MKKKKFIKLMLKIFLCVCLLISFSSCIVAPPLPPAAVLVIPPLPSPVRLAPPPPGKVWVIINGRGTLVLAPPADDPYVWVGDRWVKAPPPAVEGHEWVPGYWSHGYWHPGHWEVVRPPDPGMVWVPGYWDGPIWHPGYWRGPHPHGYVWIPGYRDSHGHWHRGYWGRPPKPPPPPPKP